VQKLEIVPEVAVYEFVESPTTLEPEDVTQDQLAVTGPEKLHASDCQDFNPTPVGELRSLRDTEEHQYEPPQVFEAKSDNGELQVEENQSEPPRIHDATPEHAGLQVLENLQSCRQVQSQVDESHTIKESPSVLSTCETHEEIKPQVKSILSSVTFTDSPSFSEWTPCEETDEHHMKLDNVEFRGCEQTGLQLKSSCDFTNVKFISCKFNRTTFLDVMLSNVTFSHVDFTDSAFCCLVLCNVTLVKLCFKNDLWRAMHLENALVGKCYFQLRQGTTREYILRAAAVSSKTIQCAIRNAKPLNKLRQELGHDGAWNRDIHRYFVPSSRGILTRLAERGGIMDRIMGHCFPGISVHIYEYPCGSKILGESAMPAKLYSKRDRTRTTYFGSLQHGLSARAEPSKYIPPRGVGNCTGLLLVNKGLSKLALKHLYSRVFHLQCSAEGAREFLVAHAQQMKMVKVLVLYYHWEDDKVGLTTDINAWRRLLNTIRHNLSFFPKIGLFVGRSFWKRNNTNESAKSLLGDHSYINCPIGDFSKFAAPDDRWISKDDQSTHRTDGTVLRIHVDDASNKLKIECVKRLVVEIEKQRVGRPLFVQSPKGAEITYRCADQFREKLIIGSGGCVSEAWF